MKLLTKQVESSPDRPEHLIRVARGKYLDCRPYCLRPDGPCDLVRTGKRGCLDAPCHFQHLKIIIKPERREAVRVTA